MSLDIAVPASHDHPPPQRDPAPILEEIVARLRAGSELWVFGYASLIWRPEFHPVEQRLATVHGYHRALRMRSRINRGTPERPGLVFALLRGGCCRGIVYRVARHDAAGVLEQLWAREMVTGVYDPRWLPCRTTHGAVQALGFTLSRRSPNFTGVLGDDELVDILRHARGRYGTTLDYLARTAHCLSGHGIRDREIERLMALARRHALVR
jgi:cation transport protein ChaC